MMLTLLPEIFEDRDPFSKDIQALLSVGSMVPLPNTLGKCGPRILCTYGYDPNIITYTTIIKASLMFFDILMIEDLNTAAFGFYVVADLGRCSVRYVLQFTPTLVTKHIYCLEIGYPLRLKGVQFENCPLAMEVTIAMANACLNGKINKRIHVYKPDSNVKGLQKEIPLEMMPIEYGGNNGSIKELGAIWKKKVESYRDWFLDSAKYKTREDVRLGPPKTSADELGIDGSFRKLDID